MRTSNDIITRLNNHYPYLAAEYAVKRIGIFGSLAHNNFTEASDVDLLIEFTRPIGLKFMELNDYLEQILGCTVDILTPAGLDNIRLPHIMQQIKERIIYVETQ